MKKFFVLVATTVTLLGCTENQRARQFGGNSQIVLPCNQKLVNATWKQDDMWYVTRPMREGETPERSQFREASNWGLLEGQVVFVECK